MFVFDLHVHTSKYSDCSFISPEELIHQALEARLDGIAITEHGVRWPDKEFNKLKKLAEPRRLVLINGQEISTESANGGTEGDFLVFGIKKSLTGRYTAQELIEIVHKNRGIIVAAHPYKLSRGGKSHYYGAGDRIYTLPVDAVELWHPDHTELALNKVRKAMNKLEIPGIGGSDAHKAFAIGSCVTLFENKIENEIDLIREIRQGKVKAQRKF
jgi:predicted metal-dependent phosphoesterase TrpH